MASPPKTRTIAASTKLRTVLGALEALGKSDPACVAMVTPTCSSIDPDDVDQWERALQRKLPDDVLVLAALKIPLLDDAVGQLAPGHEPPVAVDEELWLPLWSGDPNAMHRDARTPTYQQCADMSVCLTRHGRSGDPKVLVLKDDDGGTETTLSAFLLTRLDTYFDGFEQDDNLAQSEKLEAERLQRAWRAAKEARLEPTVEAVLTPPPKVPTVSVRVRHPKLGLGTMVSLFEGTAEVVFDSGERKKLKREFLEDA